MVMMLGLLAIIVLTWLSSAKAGTQEACPPELMSKMIEGRTIVIALARCENRPMSIADSKRLSDKIFGSVTEFQPGGSCATANFDALEQVLNEFHRNKDAFCNRARPLMRQHKL